MKTDIQDQEDLKINSKIANPSKKNAYVLENDILNLNKEFKNIKVWHIK